MGILHVRDAFSHRYLTAQITTADRAVYFVPLRDLEGDVFFAKIQGQLYPFILDRSKIYTTRGKGHMAVSTIYYSTADALPVSHEQTALLHSYLKEHALGRLGPQELNLLAAVGLISDTDVATAAAYATKDGPEASIVETAPKEAATGDDDIPTATPLPVPGRKRMDWALLPREKVKDTVRRIRDMDLRDSVLDAARAARNIAPRRKYKRTDTQQGGDMVSLLRVGQMLKQISPSEADWRAIDDTLAKIGTTAVYPAPDITDIFHERALVDVSGVGRAINGVLASGVQFNAISNPAKGPFQHWMLLGIIIVICAGIALASIMAYEAGFFDFGGLGDFGGGSFQDLMGQYSSPQAASDALGIQLPGLDGAPPPPPPPADAPPSEPAPVQELDPELNPDAGNTTTTTTTAAPAAAAAATPAAPDALAAALNRLADLEEARQQSEADWKERLVTVEEQAEQRQQSYDASLQPIRQLDTITDWHHPRSATVGGGNWATDSITPVEIPIFSTNGTLLGHLKKHQYELTDGTLGHYWTIPVGNGKVITVPNVDRGAEYLADLYPGNSLTRGPR